MNVVRLITRFLAQHMGANYSAASMDTIYGAGARSKKVAMILIAVFAIPGVFLAVERVIKTLSAGLLPEFLLSSHLNLVLIVLIIGIFFICMANIIRTQVATTHAIFWFVIPFLP
jgi:sulfate permease